MTIPVLTRVVAVLTAAALAMTLLGRPAAVAAAVVALAAAVGRLLWQVRRGDAAHRRAAQRRMAAAELEHRRLAEELRERVVQDLAAVGYALPGTPDDPALAERLAQVVQESVRTLRQVLLDVQPPELTGGTLAAAVDDLTAQLRLAGTVCLVRVPDDLPVSARGAALLYRATREALRHVDRHGLAGRVEVTAVAAGTITMTVTDDGTEALDVLGLDLLADDLVAAGGSLASTQGPGGGTTVTITVPRESSGGLDPGARTPGS